MKSSLFLMEQLISVLVFAICAAICVWIFAASYGMSRDGADTNNAVIIARSGAECYKAVNGELESAAAVLGGVYNDGVVRVSFNENLQVCGENDAVYILKIKRQTPQDAPETLLFGDISVIRGEKDIFSLAVAARR